MPGYLGHGLMCEPPQRNNRLVWDETVKIMYDLFDNVWADQGVVTVDHALDVTLPVSRVRSFRHAA